MVTRFHLDLGTDVFFWHYCFTISSQATSDVFVSHFWVLIRQLRVTFLNKALCTYNALHPK